MEVFLLLIVVTVAIIVVPALLVLGSDRLEHPWEKWGLDEPKEVESTRKP